MERSHFDIQRTRRDEWVASFAQLRDSFQALGSDVQAEFDYYFQPTFDVLLNAIVSYDLMDERCLRALEILLTMLDDAALLCDVRCGADHYISVSYADGAVSHQWDREAPHVRSRYVSDGRLADICARIGIQRPTGVEVSTPAGPAPHELVYVRSAQLAGLRRIWEAGSLSEGLAQTREQMDRARNELKTQISDHPNPDAAIEQVLAAAGWQRLSERLMDLHGCSFAWHCELDIALVDQGHEPAQMPDMFKLSDIDIHIVAEDVEGPQPNGESPSI